MVLENTSSHDCSRDFGWEQSLYLETSDEWSKHPVSGWQGSGKGTRQPQPLRRRCAATTRCFSGCRCPTGHRRRMPSRSGRAREAQQRAVLRAAWPQCRARTLLTLFHSICQDLRVTPLFNVPPHESHGRMCCAPSMSLHMNLTAVACAPGARSAARRRFGGAASAAPWPTAAPPAPPPTPHPTDARTSCAGCCCQRRGVRGCSSAIAITDRCATLRRRRPDGTHSKWTVSHALTDSLRFILLCPRLSTSVFVCRASSHPRFPP